MPLKRASRVALCSAALLILAGLAAHPAQSAEAAARGENLEGAALDDGLWGRSRDFDWGE